MKSTLEFNLPDDKDDFDLACHAGDMHSALYNIQNYLRGKVKHGHNFASVEDALDDIYQFVIDEMASLPEVP